MVSHICTAPTDGTYRRGGGFAPGIFLTRKLRTGFISHSGLKIPRENSHPSRIVLFTTEQFLPCTAKFQRVPGSFWEFPGLHSLLSGGSCMTWISIPCAKVQGNPALAPLSALGHNKQQFIH